MELKISVSSGWARATPAGTTTAGGYLLISNPTGEADRLMSITSPRAPRIELHEMAQENGMMTMRALAALDVPAGGSVSLAPGGSHIMFLDLTAPFVAGESVPVTLTFEHAGPIEVNLEVRGLDAGAPGDTASTPTMNMPAAPAEPAPPAAPHEGH
jgi:copper(I)-binding protein